MKTTTAKHNGFSSEKDLQQPKPIEEKIYFRKNGFIVENYKNNGAFIFRIFQGICQYVLDIGIFLLIMMLGWLVFGIGFWNSVFMSLGAFWAIALASLLVLKGRTIGMVICSLQVTESDGGICRFSRYFTRSLFSTIHITPIIGQVFAVCSGLSYLATRGLTPIDLLSKTVVLSRLNARKMWKIYNDYEEGEAND